jgi:hypothetical protein
MAIGEMFQNQGGDRFAREVTHGAECLLWSKIIQHNYFDFSDSTVHE